MKRLIGLGLLSVLLAPPLWAENINGREINRTASGVAFTEDIDLGRFTGVSVQAVYSDGTPAGHSVIDGVKGTAALTVLSTTSLSGKTITIDDVTLTFGSDISTGPATGNTTVIIATTVAAAFQASELAGTIDFSTAVIHPDSVVVATATQPSAYAPYLSASSTNTLWGWASLRGGVASDIDVSADTFAETNHGLTTGLKVLVSTSAGTIPGGLTAGTTYYAIRLNDNSYSLASSASNAIAGTDIDITLITGSGTVTVTPLSLVLVTGTADNTGFNWQASNDGENFFDLSLTSVTYSSEGNYLWDLGEPMYRWLRMNFTAPTSGGLAIEAHINGKR